jgi:hypothetical protein
MQRAEPCDEHILKELDSPKTVDSYMPCLQWPTYPMCLSCRKLIQWLTFQNAHHFINLSRVDPSRVAVAPIGSQRHLIVPGSPNHYCLAVSLIYVHECSVIVPKASGVTLVKKVGALLHSQEMERLIGCVGMLYDSQVLDANMYGWVLYFETKKQDHESRLSETFIYMNLDISNSFIFYKAPLLRVCLLTGILNPVPLLAQVKHLTSSNHPTTLPPWQPPVLRQPSRQLEKQE